MSISQNFPEEGPTLNLNFAGSKVLDPRITFSRSSVGTYMDANGLIVTAAADEPRFDHRYVNGEIESLGLLVEERRSNTLPYSEDFSQSDWATFGTASKSSNVETAPDGNFTADSITIPTSSGVYDNIAASASTTYTFSSYIRGTPGSTVRILLNFNSSGVTSKTVTVSNVWKRFDVTATSNASDSNVSVQYDQGNGNTFYVWGAQLEAGGFPTSYIPTSGSQATRVHDRAYYENVDQTDWFSKTEGTVVFEHTDVPYASTDDAHYPAVGFAETTGGGSQPALQYFFTKNYGAAQYLARLQSGTNVATIDVSGTGSAAPASKVGFVYKEDDYALVRNGSLVGIDTSGAVPNAYMLLFGMNTISNTDNNWNAHLKNLQYYPTRLSNTVLQNLTK